MLIILLTGIRKNRKTNRRKLYEQLLIKDKSEFAFTLDEALIYENEIIGQSRIVMYWRNHTR